MKPERLNQHLSTESDPRFAKIETETQSQNPSYEEIEKKILDTEDDIDLLINEVIPNLPTLYNSSGKEIDKKELIKNIKAVRSGADGLLNYITNQYSLRAVVERQVYTERITNQIEPIKNINDLVFLLSDNEFVLKEIDGRILDNGLLISAINKMIEAVNNKNSKELQLQLQYFTPRFGLMDKVRTIFTEMWRENLFNADKVEESAEENDSHHEVTENDNQAQLKEEFKRIEDEYTRLKRDLPNMKLSERSEARARLYELMIVMNSISSKIDAWGTRRAS